MPATPRVFISWSGPKSGKIARKLHEMLDSVVPISEMFLSSETIAPGTRWSHEVTEALAHCVAGVAVVTSDNFTNPWLLFEAGAISNQVTGGRMMPLLCGIPVGDLAGSPLNSFQAKELNREGVFAIAKMVAEAHDLDWPESKLQRLFEPWWDLGGRALLDLASEDSRTGGAKPKPATLEDVAARQEHLGAMISEISASQHATLSALARLGTLAPAPYGAIYTGLTPPGSAMGQTGFTPFQDSVRATGLGGALGVRPSIPTTLHAVAEAAKAAADLEAAINRTHKGRTKDREPPDTEQD